MTSRLRRRDESGLTLIELLVTMFIVGIVGAIVSRGLIQGMRTSADVQNRIAALTDLQKGLERVARELRVANPLCLTTGEEQTHLGASVYRSNKRYVYDYYLSGTGAAQELLQDVTVFDPPDAATGTVQSSGLFIAQIGNDLLGRDLFTYYNEDGGAATSYATAARVEITLARQVQGTDPVVVSTSVEIRNTRYTGGGTTC